MNDITIRFLRVYEYLIGTGELSKQSEFADLIGISTSSFTEIRKGRTNAGLNVIQKTVMAFDWLSLDWLLKGEGTLDKRQVKNDYNPSTNEGIFDIDEGRMTYNAPPN